jgi:hypothetical protein
MSATMVDTTNVNQKVDQRWDPIQMKPIAAPHRLCGKGAFDLLLMDRSMYVGELVIPGTRDKLPDIQTQGWSSRSSHLPHVYLYMINALSCVRFQVVTLAHIPSIYV